MVLLGVAKELRNWKLMVRKVKAIYHTLNMFNVDVTTKCLIGECWIPITDVETARKTLIECSVSTLDLSGIRKTLLMLKNCYIYAR